MREKLKEAIVKLDETPLGHWPIHNSDYRDTLAPVIAAARAYSCEKCGGTGETFFFNECDKCKKDREVADG